MTTQEAAWPTLEEHAEVCDGQPFKAYMQPWACQTCGVFARDGALIAPRLLRASGPNPYASAEFSAQWAREHAA